MPKKVILDVDTGTDDSVAIMTALLSPDIQLEAICTTWGNLTIEETTRNTLAVVERMGADVPVYKGCHTAMCKMLVGDRLPRQSRIAYNEQGEVIPMHLSDMGLPDPTIKEQPTPATLFYIDYLKKATEPVTLIPVGSLTNLGHAFRIAPEIVRNVEKIVIMGGGNKISNVTMRTEANVWCDPEAAQIVLHSGAEVLWVPLDATHEGCLTLEDCQRFRALNTFAGDFTAELTEHRIKVYGQTQPLSVPDAAPVHDALAVCAVIDPTVLKDVEHVHCEIGFNDFGDGQTIIDRREKPDAPNCWWAYDADRFKFADMLCDILGRGCK